MTEKNIIREHLKKYPKMQFADAVKLSVQSVFGAAHFSGSFDAARDQIKKEISAFECDPSIFICEDIGSHVRLELKNPLVRDIGEDFIAALFFHSAEDDKAEANEEKFKALSDLFGETKEIFSPSNEEKALADHILKRCSRGVFESVSHSGIYRKEYAPSYRVLSKKHFRLFPVLDAVKRLPETKGRIVIALEGRCASGKSTAAEILSKILGAPVVPMDELFLPFNRKTPERLAEAGGNIDYERFSSEILPFLNKRESFTYNAYNCSDGIYYAKTVPSSKIVIVEGVYSMRPEFIKAYDIKVFFNISKETQIKRLEKRNPALLSRFINEWIPMEENYFNKLRVKDNCNVIIGESCQ